MLRSRNRLLVSLGTLLLLGTVIGLSLLSAWEPPKERTPSAVQQDELSRLREELRRLNRDLEKLDPKPEARIPADKVEVTGNQPGILRGHRGRVQCVAISLDGQIGMTGGTDGTLRGWDLSSGKELFSKETGQRQVLSVAISGDKKFIATGGVTNEVKVWRVEDQELEATIPTSAIAQTLAFSPEKPHLLIGCGAQVTYWRGEGQPVHTANVGMDFVRSVGFSADGKLGICAGGYFGNQDTAVDAYVRVWNLETNEIVFRVKHPVRTIVMAAVIGAENRELLAGNPSGGVQLWDIAADRELHLFKTKGSPHALAISGDGQMAVSANFDTLDLLDVKKRSVVHPLPVPRGGAMTVAMSRDGRTVIAAGIDDVARYWKVTDQLLAQATPPQRTLATPPSSIPVPARDQAESRRLTGHQETVLGIAVASDGKQLLSSGFDSSVRLWDLATGKELQRRQRPQHGDSGHVKELVLSKDGTLALLCGEHSIQNQGGLKGAFKVYVWDVQQWKEVKQLSHDHMVLDAALSPDHRFAVTTCGDGVARMWDVRAGVELKRFGDVERGLRAIDYAPDGLHVVTANMDGKVRIFEVDSGKEIRTMEGARGITSLVFSPDGKQVVAAGNEVTLWDIATGNKLRSWQAKKDQPFTSVAFSPDSRQLVTTSLDRYVRVWDAASGAEVRALQGHDGPATQALFTPDGKQMVSSSYDGTIRLWSLDPTSVSSSRRDDVAGNDIPALKLGRVSAYSGGAGVKMTVGWEFAVTEPAKISELGLWDSDGKGLDAEVEVGVWDPQGNLLTSAKVPTGTSARLVDGFRYVPVKPCELKPGGPYVIGGLYVPGTKDGVISGSSGIEFASAGPIRWLKGRRSLHTETLKLPEASNNLGDQMPGSFGPNFLMVDEKQKRVSTWYRTREGYPLGNYRVVLVPPNPDGSLPEEKQPITTLFAGSDGRLTQIVFEETPLGAGEEGFRKLVSEVEQRYPRNQQDRPFLRVAAMSSVRFEDVLMAMNAVSGNGYQDATRLAAPPFSRGQDLLPLGRAKIKQAQRDGKFIDPERFRDAGAYLEDRWTGLLWQKDGRESGKMNFYQAAEYADRLEIGGMKGWRVPKAEELTTIFPADFSPFSNTQYRPEPCCQAGGEYPGYWTSDLDRGTKDYAFVYQWYENGGANNCYASRNYAYVRCVHDPAQQ